LPPHTTRTRSCWSSAVCLGQIRSLESCGSFASSKTLGSWAKRKFDEDLTGRLFVVHRDSACGRRPSAWLWLSTRKRLRGRGAALRSEAEVGEGALASKADAREYLLAHVLA
jgi:hypothetical protein